MNRLVIIGNGFDLAHGLPTSYGHFINDFWRNLKDNYNKDTYKEIVYINEKHKEVFDVNQIEDYGTFINNLKDYVEKFGWGNFDVESGSFEIQGGGIEGVEVIFEFRNSLLKKINNKHSSQNWVDIENEYYKELKKLILSMAETIY